MKKVLGVIKEHKGLALLVLAAGVGFLIYRNNKSKKLPTNANLINPISPAYHS